MDLLSKTLKLFFRFNSKIENNLLLRSIRRGLTYMIPLFLIGSISLLFASLPIPLYQKMMREMFGNQWGKVFVYIHDGIFNILSLITVLCISYSYAVESSENNRYNLGPISVACVSLCSFIAISGINELGLCIDNFGVTGVFIAIIVAILSSVLFSWLSTIQCLRMKVISYGANPGFNHALNSIFPTTITIVVFVIINFILTSVLGIFDLQSFISNLVSGVFIKMNSTFWSGILFVSLIHFFWFFGMHGSNILEPVARTIFIPALITNQYLISLGAAPTEIFTKTFFDTFVLMGGCGTSLCLILAIFIVKRNKSQQQLAKLSLMPVIFNINELVIFGIPIVLNPIYIIPFLIVPNILTMTSYLSLRYGLVPYTRNLVEWTTPVFLSGYVSTGSINGSILQLFNLVIGTFCYIPFVKLSQKLSQVQVKNNLEKVCDYFRQSEEAGMIPTLLSRYDDIGNISRLLAADLEDDLRNNKITLFYQPQLDYDGNVLGFEELLRWNHSSYGYVYPPLIIALAEESKLMDKLGIWILDTACCDLKKVHNMGYKNLALSVNISATQLESENFMKSLDEIVSKYQIEPKFVNIEITEQVALTRSKKIINNILSIKDRGYSLEMDDFGMGHSSLMYLKEYNFNTIKLDGSLVRDILTNINCQNIITSIIQLGQSLNYSVIAEYVENDEQRQILYKLGCNNYQGYFYSKAIPYDELIEYIGCQRSEFNVSKNLNL